MDQRQASLRFYVHLTGEWGVEFKKFFDQQEVNPYGEKTSISSFFYLISDGSLDFSQCHVILYIYLFAPLLSHPYFTILDDQPFE